MSGKQTKRERKAMKLALADKPVETKFAEVYANLENMEGRMNQIIGAFNELQRNFLRGLSNICTALGVEIVENEDGTISWKVLAYKDESIRGIIPFITAGHEKLKGMVDAVAGKKKNDSMIVIPGRK